MKTTRTTLLTLALALSSAQPLAAQDTPPVAASSSPAGDDAATPSTSPALSSSAAPEAPTEPAIAPAEGRDAPDASEDAATTDVSPPTVLVTPVRAGALIPQVFNLLETSFTIGLGAGYVLPVLDHRLALVVEGAYTRPERSQTLDDPRLAAGSYRYTLVQHDVSVFAGVLVHFTDLARDVVVPYAGLGARVHFTWSEIDALSGEVPTGFHRETSTQGGGALRAGAGIRLGPGLIVLDVELALAPLDHLVTGAANLGDLAIAAGYTFVL